MFEARPDTERPTEDVYDFVQRSHAAPYPTADAAQRPPLLEVSQLWGQILLDTRHYTLRSRGRDITVGSRIGHKWHLLGVDMGWVSPRLASLLPLVPPMWSEVRDEWRDDFCGDPSQDLDSPHTLFAHDPVAERYTARVHPSWDGFIDTPDGQRLSFEQGVVGGRARAAGGIIEIPMTEGTRVMVDIEGIVFLGHQVPSGARIATRVRDEVDYPFAALLSFAAFAGLLFAALMWFSTPPPTVAILQIDEDDFAHIVLTPPPAPVEQPTSEGAGDRAKDKEGARPESKTAPRRGPATKQMLDRQVAESAGPMALLNTSAFFSQSGLGETLADRVEGLRTQSGWSPGGNGLGDRGGHLGGGGDADGIGDDMGTHGVGAGKSGYGVGPRTAKEDRNIRSVAGEPIIMGAIDSALIDAVIKQHMSQIKYCYSRQLTKNPSLGGKLSLKFVIANDGSVSNAQVKSSTLGDEAVDACMVRQFLRMRFPAPKGNGIVVVSYPFHFTRGA